MPTGQTVRECWVSLALEERWGYRRDMRVKIYVSRDVAAIERVWNEMKQTRPETITGPDDISPLTMRTWGKISLGMM